MVHGKLITQGTEITIKRESTFSLVIIRDSFNNRLLTMRWKKFTDCLCYFICPHRSYSFIFFIMSTIQVIDINQYQYSIFQLDNHIQTQTRGGTIFFEGSNNHLELKLGDTSSIIHKTVLDTIYSSKTLIYRKNNHKKSGPQPTQKQKSFFLKCKQ